MKAKILAIMAVLIMSLTVIPMAGLDASEAENVTFRTGFNTLNHMTAEANMDVDVPKGCWVYEVGGDSSMKSYIDDSSHMTTPDPGIKKIVAGTQYEVYYVIDIKELTMFEKATSETALPSYFYEIVVEESTAKKVKATRCQSFDGDDIYGFEIRYVDKGIVNYRFSIIYAMNILNYSETIDGYSFVEQSATNLYVEFDVEITVKEFTDSPYLFAGVCIAITVLIGLLIAYCGRKPKF